MSFNESRSYIKGFTTVPTAITVFITTVKIWHFIHLIDFFFFLPSSSCSSACAVCIKLSKTMERGPVPTQCPRSPAPTQSATRPGAGELWNMNFHSVSNSNTNGSATSPRLHHLSLLRLFELHLPSFSWVNEARVCMVYLWKWDINECCQIQHFSFQFDLVNITVEAVDLIRLLISV